MNLGNTVYPGPPQKGVQCVICPKCQGDCGPRGIMERRTLTTSLAEAYEAIRKLADSCTLKGFEDDGTFSTSNIISRQEFLKALESIERSAGK